MNVEEAKKIVFEREAWTIAMNSGSWPKKTEPHSWVIYNTAKGYLEALEGSEVKNLLETLKNMIKEDFQCMGQEGRDCWKSAIKALDAFRKAVGKPRDPGLGMKPKIGC